jgi:anti-sigma factor RsiW
MSGLEGRAEELEYWRRWRATSRKAAPVDPLLLAAYAEGRLDETAAEPVEAWLADNPEALEDIIAARAARDANDAAVPEGHIVRASALLAPAAEIVPFPSARVVRRRGWRDAAAWGAIAASLLATSMFGFELGSSAYANLFPQQQPAAAADSTANELIDPPTGLFTEDEEPAT